MRKPELLTLVVLAALAISGAAHGDLVDPILSTATVSPGPHCLLADPAGGGDRLDAIGAVITLVARDGRGLPLGLLPATDYWLIGATDHLALCGGDAAVDADSMSNLAGQTTMSGTLSVGGCDQGVQAVIQGVVLQGPVLPITVVTADIDGDLATDTPDFALFALGYTSPPKAYDYCLDFGCTGEVELIDFALFAQHYLVVC